MFTTKLKSALLALGVLVVVGMGSGLLAKSPTPTWQLKMQEASRLLVDAFPFVYSKLEFKDPKNSQRISGFIRDLRKTSHSLPVSESKKFIGLDPLIDRFRRRITEVLGHAEKNFKAKKYDVAQNQVKMVIHKCVACHTAYQMGPQINRMNNEVKGFLLSPMGKVEVLVALRQFNAALDVLEQQFHVKTKSKKKAVNLMPYLRMHLLISVRALQDLDRGKKAIKSYRARSKAATKDPKPAQWQKDLKWWSQQKGSVALKLKKLEARELKSPGADGDPYVRNLLRTFLLHQTLVDLKDSRALAQAYARLGQAYNGLQMLILEDLPTIYVEACTKTAPKKAKGQLCQL